MLDILDKETQEKLNISSWLQHSGTQLYEKRLRDVMAKEFIDLNQILFSGKALSSLDLPELNKKISKLEALRECLMTKLSIEELVQVDPEEGEQISKEKI
jgi:hypothetical protein